MIQSVDHHDIAMSQGLMEHFNDDDFNAGKSVFTLPPECKE